MAAIAAILSSIPSSSSSKFSKYQSYPSAPPPCRVVCRGGSQPPPPVTTDFQFALHDALDSSGINTTHARVITKCLFFSNFVEVFVCLDVNRKLPDGFFLLIKFDTVLMKYEILFYFYMVFFFGRNLEPIFYFYFYFFVSNHVKVTYLSLNLEPLFLAKILMWGFSKMVKLISD